MVLRLPAAEGVKVTEKVVLPPASTLLLMPVLLTTKSVAFPPVTDTPARLKAPSPVLLIVKVSGALVPLVRLPKLWLPPSAMSVPAGCSTEISRLRGMESTFDSDGMPLVKTVMSKCPGAKAPKAVEVKPVALELAGVAHITCELPRLRSCTSGKSAAESCVPPPEAPEMPRKVVPEIESTRPTLIEAVVTCGRHAESKPRPGSRSSVVFKYGVPKAFPLVPPAISTLPVVSQVSNAPVRPVESTGPLLQVPVAGL